MCIYFSEVKPSYIYLEQTYEKIFTIIPLNNQKIDQYVNIKFPVTFGN